MKKDINASLMISHRRMFMRFMIPVIVLAFFTTACHSKKDANLSPGIDVANLDTTVSPRVDFYQYACGGWMKNNPLTGEYAMYGSFNKLDENNRKQLRGLIEEIASKSASNGTVEQKIGDVYNLAMDSNKLFADGYKPIQADLKKIAKAKNYFDILKLMPGMLLSGLDPYFTVYVFADPKNSSMYLVQTYQSGISLYERDYYLDNDPATQNIRDKYKTHIVKMFELVGFNPTEAQKNMEAVLHIESSLAKAASDKVKLRDPQANYHKMTVDDLQKLVPEINWKEYLTALGLKNTKEISVSQKESLMEVGKLIASEPIAAQIAYLQWKLIDGAAPYLSDPIYAENFDFYGKTLAGKKEPSPRWKRAVNTINDALGEAVGQMYVKKYFSPEAKQRIIKLVHNLQGTLAERIKALTWMSDSTKEKALDKLKAFYIKIGYPDRWRNYSKLDISKDSYYANVRRANMFEFAYRFNKAGKKVDKWEWQMTPQMVNAYYEPSTNEICFPAGILQYPFFDMNADDAFNYGAIGAIIGHEMTHGFDDQGRQYDKEGNMKDWWTAKDGRKFNARAKVMADYFDGIQVAQGVHENGKFTLGENIADYGGLQISYQAFKKATANIPPLKKEGFTLDERSFLAYATIWAGNVRPEELLLLVKTDPHSIIKWRVDGELPQIQGWYDAFGIKKGDPMFIPEDKRVAIW